MDRWKSRGLAAVLALGATLLAPAGEAVEAGRQQGMSRFGNVRNPSSGGVVPQLAGHGDALPRPRTRCFCCSRSPDGARQG